MVPLLRGDGVTNGRPGGAESHQYDTELQPSASLHCSPLQGVLAGNHPHGQPEEVSMAHACSHHAYGTCRDLHLKTTNLISPL